MEKAYLQWNLVNWITVVLMASFGVVVVGFIASGLRSFNGQKSNAG